MKLLLAAAVTPIDPDRRVLIAQRPRGKSFAGLWEFPGGKVEVDERPEAALIRELHEELGIAVEETCLAPLTFASFAKMERGSLRSIEPGICSQRKPRSFRCSAQPAGSRGVRRINVWALSFGGLRPLMMSVVMSGASQGRRRRE